MKNTGSNGSEPRPRKSHLGEAGRWLPGVVISAIAFYAIFHLVSFEELSAAFSTINLIYIIPGVFFVVFWLILRALALKVILSGKAGMAQTFRAINVGYLLNNILPLRAGEIGKAVVLGQSSGLGVTKVLSGIVIERAFDLFFAAALLLAVLPLVLEMSWAKTVAIVVLVLVVCGLFALYIMARKNEVIQAWIQKVGKKWPWVSKYIQPQIATFLSGFSILTDFRQFLVCLLAIGSSWGVAVLMYYVMMFSIIPAPQFWWGVFVNSILAMGIAIPSAPAALGVFEASVVAALKVLGTSYSNALAYAVVMHFLQIAITAIFGVYGLIKEKQSLDSLFNLSRKMKQKDETENPVARCEE
ncbi:MAG: flippase-like domain-containing protein [Chloroflexi bacterium]|nr:flippase-like domain-containing protein [Chloroflexota bacterium]